MKTDDRQSGDPADKPPQSVNDELAAWKLTATAYHEAGHAVMALSLGRTIEKVTISPSEMQTGGSRLGACKVQKGQVRGSSDRLEDDALILFAGMVAESQFTSRYCQEGAAQDLMAVRRLLARRAPDERQTERLARRMLKKTEHLLGSEAHSRAIAMIAQELLRSETISGRAARHFFQRALKDGS